MTYVALKSAAFIDGEDEDDVLACFEGFLKDTTVLNLGGPDRLKV
jgi:hypothetical protein